MHGSRPLVTRRALVGLLGLGGAACAVREPSAPEMVPPLVTMAGLRLDPPIDGVAQTVVRLDLANPNPEPLVVETLRCAVVVNGIRLGETAVVPWLDVPPVTRVAVDLVLQHPDSAPLAALRLRPPPRGVAYRITGDARLVAPGLDRLEFGLEGTWLLR